MVDHPKLSYNFLLSTVIGHLCCLLKYITKPSKCVSIWVEHIFIYCGQRFSVLQNPEGASKEDICLGLATWELLRGDHQGGKKTPCKIFPKAPIINPKPLVAVHLDNLIKDEDKEEAKDMEKDNKEEDGTRVEGGWGDWPHPTIRSSLLESSNAGGNASQRIGPYLTVDDAMDMYPREAMAAFRE